MIKSNCGNAVITVIVVVAIMQHRVHTKKTFNHSILAPYIDYSLGLVFLKYKIGYLENQVFRDS